MRKKRVLVIGGSGFIGSRLIDRLLSSGYDVKNYDIMESKKHPYLTVIGDVRDLEMLLKHGGEVDIIFNLAAEHKDNVYPSSLYYEVNVLGSQNVVHVAKLYNVKKIVFVSSAAIYGLHNNISTETTPSNPFNDYGKSKLQAEKVYDRWYNEDNRRTLIIVRPAAIFGEGNRGNIYNFMKFVLEKKYFIIGRGDNKKSIGYVENIADFLVFVLKLKEGNKYVFNYADKPDLSIKELTVIIKKIAGLKVPSISIPYSVALGCGLMFDFLSKIFKRDFSISSQRVKKLCSATQISCENIYRLGFVPRFTLEEAIERTLRHEFSDKIKRF